MRLIYYVLLPLLLLISCSKHRANLDWALEQADYNRGELEKVLNYYSMNQSDSLKLKAAIFLIENMPGHYSYKGDEVLKYYEEIDSILDSDSQFAEKYEHLKCISAKYPQINQNLIEDIKIMTSEYLIRNIDSAFELWAKPWASHLSFDEFCEALLPYKCTEFQQLDYWRDSLTTKFSTCFDTGYDGLNVTYPYHHYSLVLIELQSKIIEHQGDFYNYYKPLSASNLHKIPFGTCYDYETVLVSVMRSKGIPVVRDSYPRWGKRTYVGHGWPTLINKSHVYLPAIWGFRSLPGDVFLPMDEIPKVYRATYARNPEVSEYMGKTKYVCDNIDLFSIDVTDEYTATSDLSIPVCTDRLKDKYAYISMFSGRQWVVMDYGKIRRNKALFSKMGRNMVYIVSGYNGQVLVPISDPFILDRDGSIKYLEPDNSNLNTITISRKYPAPFDELSLYEGRSVGGEIQASNRADFKEYDTICTINKHSSYIPTNTSAKYRYWRYYSKPDSWCNIAELQFFEPNNQEYSKGEIIGNIAVYPYENMEAENAFDGDWLTCYHYLYPHDGWIGLDFGEPLSIERVMCAPRSDDNGIHLGEEYELKYWGNDKWNSSGIQTAKDCFLQFDSIPDNVILWLHNHTAGVQERIFTYKDGKQIWW